MMHFGDSRDRIPHQAYRRLALCGWLVAVLPLAALAADPVPADSEPGEAITFEQHIRPIFRKYCFDCHGATEEYKGGLDLRLRRLMLEGGDSGEVLVPGDPEGSYLLQRVRSGEMPPGDHRVEEAETELLARWIAAGAPTARPEPEQIDPGIGITREEREFWFFQPIAMPEVPSFAAEARVRTPIDALLLAAMQPQGLGFSPDADRLTLIRRASLDLRGLPPSREEIQRFVEDPAVDAYEQLIERLLASPEYGERWGRHWLDIAGYADSEGYDNQDAIRPYAYKYRDYVIRSLNVDKPLDQFLTEQLAGDELVEGSLSNLTDADIERLVATGFLRMAADGTGGSGVDPVAARNQVVADTIKIVSSGLLGLSVACAQCHDHRYDPISHEDYFRLRAIFEPAYYPAHWRNPTQRRISLYTDADRARAAEVEAEAAVVIAERTKKQQEYMAAALELELAKHPEALREPLRKAYQTAAAERSEEQQKLLKMYPSVNISPGVLYQYNPEAAEDLKKYDARIAEIRAKKPVEDFVRALTEIPGQIPTTRLFYRGDPQQPRQEVLPGDLTVAAPPGEPFAIPADDPDRPTTGRRLAFAQRLTGPDHPLFPRVLVNRIWMHHFGRGLVNTPGDFGIMGDRPTHPELLDWLAETLRREGWSLKQLHRQIMTSTVYRQSSVRTEHLAAVDPDNRWYARQNVRRLDAEVIRDSILAASGRLQSTMYGPPIPVQADATGQIVVEGAPRRSLYVQVRRTQPVAMLTAFDAPVMETNCEVRPSSTVATQSLMMMNSKFLLEQAAAMAQRVAEAPPGPIQLPQATGEQLVAARPASAPPAPKETDAVQTDAQRAAAALAPQVAAAWQLAFSRPIEAEELRLSLEYLAGQWEHLPSDGKVSPQRQAMTNYCQTLLSSNEFLYCH